MNTKSANTAPAANPQPETVTATVAGESPEATLPRNLGVGSAISMVVGLIVGSGIFRVPSSIAADMSSTGAIALVWVLGGLITLCMALSLAELAALYPRAGGNFVYIREAYGPLPAFLYGWTFMFINPAMWASIALIFAEYLGQFVPLSYAGRSAVAAALICSATLANYRSVRLAVYIQNLATVAKAIAIFVVAAVIFALGSKTDGALGQPVSFEMPAIGTFGVTLIGVLFAYEGAASFCAVAGEVRDPRRSLPFALTGGVITVIVLYLLINAAYLYALPIGAMASSHFVAADAIMKVAGSTAASVVAALVMLTTFGTIVACAIVDPRVFYAMAQDGLFFRNIGTVHPRFQTPHLAVLISGAIAITYVSLHSFEELTTIFILGLWPFYALAAFAVIILRRRHPNLARPYRTPGYPLVPLIFVASGVLIFINSLIEQPGITLINIGVTLAGVPAYFVWTALMRRKRIST